MGSGYYSDPKLPEPAVGIAPGEVSKGKRTWTRKGKLACQGCSGTKRHHREPRTENLELRTGNWELGTGNLPSKPFSRAVPGKKKTVMERPGFWISFVAPLRLLAAACWIRPFFCLLSANIHVITCNASCGCNCFRFFHFLPSWESNSVVEDLLFCSSWKSVAGVFVCVCARAPLHRSIILGGGRFFSCFHNSHRNQNEQSRKRRHSFSLYNVGSRCSSTAGQWRYYCCFFLLFCCLSHFFLVYLLFSQYYWLL